MRLRNEKAIACGITAVALAVRLYFAYTLYLNPDECMHLLAGSAGEWSTVHHPPLLLWWLWLATLVSDQVWWLRLLPVMAGGLTPLAVGFWLRRFLSPSTAWGLAALVAVSPNLVLLSIQLRGYSTAMLGTALALYTLDRAFEERSRRRLGWHFAALLMAVLSEFGAVWVVLAAGLYGAAMLARRVDTRRLFPLWAAGQMAMAAVLGALYYFVVRVVTAAFPTQKLLAGYLHGSVPAPGQNPLVFVGIGIWKQFAYAGSSWALGLLAAVLAAAGMWVWWRKGEERLVLVTAVFLAVGAALAMIFPFGRTRHTVLIGLVGLAATGVGLEQLGRWKAVVAVMAAAALCLLPTPDAQNIRTDSWERVRWERAIQQVESAVPEGATTLADLETFWMWQTALQPRGIRQLKSTHKRQMNFGGRRVVSAGVFDWLTLPAEEILARAPAGPVWIVDMGFDAESVKARARELGLTAVVDEPGVLYLGRLR